MATVTGGVERYAQWSREMTRKRIPGWGENAANKVFIQVGDSLVLGTPVGDASYWQSPPPKGYTGGRARGGWQASQNHPAQSDINRIDPSGAAARAEVSKGLAGWKLGVRRFWTNSTPYILRLAHGWSRQAPDGWVPRALRQIANQFG